MTSVECTTSRRRRRAVLAGIVVGTLLGATYAAGAASGPSGTEVTIAAAPARVSGLSNLLDTFQTGSAAGPGIINGIVTAVVGSQPIAPPGDQVQSALIQAVEDLGAQITKQGPAGIGALRDAIAPLACANPAINGGLETLATGLDGLAEGSGAAIAPFDLTATEMATLLRGFEAPEVPC